MTHETLSRRLLDNRRWVAMLVIMTDNYHEHSDATMKFHIDTIITISAIY